MRTHPRTSSPLPRNVWRVLGITLCVLAQVRCSGTVSIHGEDATHTRVSPQVAADTMSSPPAAAPTSTGVPLSGEPASATQPSAASGSQPCRAETDAALCARLEKECGRLVATDRCGAQRAVMSCGQCSAPQTCGGDGLANVCGSADTEDREQALVVVRHGESRSNECARTCGGPSCCGAFACPGGCSSCYCAPLEDELTEAGQQQVTEILPQRLGDLGMDWDQILVSPALRTQLTIRSYLERHDLRGVIVPELDECSVTTACPSDSCARPPWRSEPYPLADFAGGVARLTQRPYRAEWDPDPQANPRPRYDHAAAHREGENAIMDRAARYIDEQFEAGASAVLIVTHHDVGRGLLQRLTGSSDDFSLDNAGAYTILKRTSGATRWSVEEFNADP